MPINNQIPGVVNPTTGWGQPYNPNNNPITMWGGINGSYNSDNSQGNLSLVSSPTFVDDVQVLKGLSGIGELILIGLAIGGSLVCWSIIIGGSYYIWRLLSPTDQSSLIELMKDLGLYEEYADIMLDNRPFSAMSDHELKRWLHAFNAILAQMMKTQLSCDRYSKNVAKVCELLRNMADDIKNGKCVKVDMSGYLDWARKHLAWLRKLETQFNNELSKRGCTKNPGDVVVYTDKCCIAIKKLLTEINELSTKVGGLISLMQELSECCLPTMVAAIMNQIDASVAIIGKDMQTFSDKMTVEIKNKCKSMIGPPTIPMLPLPTRPENICPDKSKSGLNNNPPGTRK